MQRPLAVLLAVLAMLALPAGIGGAAIAGPSGGSGALAESPEAIGSSPIPDDLTPTAIEPADESDEPSSGGTDAIGTGTTGTNATPAQPEAGVNTTTRLGLPDESNTVLVLQGGDLGGSLAADDRALRLDQQVHRLEYDLERAENESERLAAIDAVEMELDARIDALEARERTAVQAHANGEIGDRELARTFVANYRDAETLETAIEEFERIAAAEPGADPDIGEQRARLDIQTNPVRERLAALADGHAGVDGDVTVVSITAHESGHVLSVIEEGQYHREAIRYDHRDTDTPTQFETISEAFDRAFELYPWTLGISSSSPSMTGHLAIQLYELNAPHEQGVLRSYIDGGTADAHAEVQHLELEALPIRERQTWQEGAIQVEMNRTPADGPAKLEITDATGDPADATVFVDGFEYGTAGPDGTMWIMPPPVEFELAIEHGDEELNVTVPPGS